MQKEFKMVHAQHDVDFFKNAINRESIINLSFNYLTVLIEDWWENFAKNMPVQHAKFQLISLLLSSIKQEDLVYFDLLGARNVSAISITDIFKTDCPKLSLVVHEALSELFSLNDIKYSYEDHKKLYLKPSGENYKNWGNGYGEITPHSDDLYEDLDVDFLSLTVCRDNTKTPTVLYFPKDILANFTDFELARILDMKANFVSGKNVQVIKMRQRKIVEYIPEQGFRFFLDFRIDNDTGERMLAVKPEDKELIDKMRANLSSCVYTESLTRTGTFLIVANYKVLHARAQMNMNREMAAKISKNINYSNAPRLLFRSKGQDSKILNNYLRG